VGTVSKALELLNIMAEPNAPAGLTKLALAAGYDKATTRRMLLELSANGFVEQDSETRNYALGPALQFLGRARENSFPLLRTLQPFVRNLAKQTEEMVHASEYGNGVLYSICIEESTRANRVSLDLGQKLPLHATASGIAFLAKASDAIIEVALRKPLKDFTRKTPTQRDSLLRSIIAARELGYSIGNQTFDEGVHSVAAAFTGPQAKPLGTIAIAMPSIRATPAEVEANGKRVREAALEISNLLTGRRTSRHVY
jgi:DNA-binding IclR family transcriptional regulator